MRSQPFEYVALSAHWGPLFMQFIPLRKNGETIFALVDDEDYERFGSFRWWCQSEGYACGRHTGSWKDSGVYLHKLIVNPPAGYFVDHINGNRLDNRRCNLRICTRQQNNANKRKYENQSGYKGVQPNGKSGWGAFIVFNKTKIWMGTYQDKEEAAWVYDQAALQLFGEFAKTNF